MKNTTAEKKYHIETLGCQANERDSQSIAGIFESLGIMKAKAISEAFREATGEADLATKRDLNDFELRVEARIDKLDTRIGGELTLVKWMLGVIIAAEAMPWFVKLFT